MTNQTVHDFKLTLKEIDLITKLRELKFGVIEVHKIESDLVRIIYKENILLDEKNGLTVLSNGKTIL